MEVHSVVTEHLSWGRGILSAAGNPTTEQAGWRGLIDKSPRQQPVRGLLAPSAGHQGVGGGGRKMRERYIHTGVCTVYPTTIIGICPALS